MGKRDPRVTAYIARSAEFARPILTHLRDVIHETCPKVEETLKWGHPSFTYHGILGGMAAFKQHCTFGLWKHSLIVGKVGSAGAEAWGNFGRLTKVTDLPRQSALTRYLKEGMRLNEEGIAVKRTRSAPKKPLPVPADLAAGLLKNRKARATFEGFAPSHRREYIEWITEAKREETRARRLATTLEWLAEGKSRNWKYEKC